MTAVQEPTATPVELTQIVVSGARALHRRTELIETEAAAPEIANILRGVITAAQELLGVVEHISGSDRPAPVEEFTGEWAEITADRTYTFGPDGGQR